MTGDRLALMETFVRIVEAGSLSAAAPLLQATQPTISRRLAALEKMLGVRLLQRSTHAIRLTVDGERCYTRAKELLAYRLNSIHNLRFMTRIIAEIRASILAGTFNDYCIVFLDRYRTTDREAAVKQRAHWLAAHKRT